jgi:CBS domain-containing protein
MMTIRDVIRNREPYSVRDTMNLLEAAEYMANRKIGGVCVINDEDRLVGILTERDLLNRVVVPQRNPSALQVNDAMSALVDLAVIETIDTPHEALERMERTGRRHLPVVEGQRWVGMLSMRDLLRVELGERGDELKLLHEYISQ